MSITYYVILMELRKNEFITRESKHTQFKNNFYDERNSKEGYTESSVTVPICIYNIMSKTPEILL